MSRVPSKFDRTQQRAQRPFRRAVLRGLAVILPPLLTLAILIWVWNAVQEYVLVPVESGARNVIVWLTEDVQNISQAEFGAAETVVDGVSYTRLVHGQFVPTYVYDVVRENLGSDSMPETGTAVYERYVDVIFLPPYVVIPVFLCVFILLLYLLGKFLAGSVGRMFWNLFEQIIHRLPVIRNVYSSVKQVTDFVFTEQEVQFTRVVGVEYPRQGIWSMGFVTGESLLDIRNAANEPVLSVLIPTSPMPVTGFTITVCKSDTVDLDITIDQAIQFIVSCGVVIPSQQLQNRQHAAPSSDSTATDVKIPVNGGSSQQALTAPTVEQTDQ